MLFLLDAAVALLLLSLVLYFWGAFQFEVLPADVAAHRLWEYWQSRPEYAKTLPDFLHGVWWMHGNPADEVLVCFSGCKYDAATRSLWVRPSGKYNWSLCTSFQGMLGYVLVNVIGRTHIRIRWDEAFTAGVMDVYAFYFIPIPRCLCDWRLAQTGESKGSYDRNSSLFSSAPFKAYTLIRVLDQDGRELPAFEDFVQAVVEGKGEPTPAGKMVYKTPTQKIPSSRVGLCCC